MTTGLTVDTSVIVPAVSAWHPRHVEARAVLGRQATAIVGHTLVEAFSVLTRLPAPFRVEPRLAGQALGALDLPVVTLQPEDFIGLISRLGERSIGGGAAYDALVGATAKHHGLRLVSADSRARKTYDVVGAEMVNL